MERHSLINSGPHNIVAHFLLVMVIGTGLMHLYFNLAYFVLFRFLINLEFCF